MKQQTSFLAATALLFIATASGHGNGLIGYGQWWYDPRCAYACRAVISSAALDCPDDSMSGMDMSMDMSMSSPTAPCIAHNSDFLSTLAYCISTRCPVDGVSTSNIEAYWADQATGDATVPARWTYGATLANVTEAPTRVFESGDTLNYTAVISDADYEYQYGFDKLFDWVEMIQSTYTIVIITVGVGIPIIMTLLGHLPFVASIFDKLKVYLVYPSTVGTYNVRPLPYMIGNAPTMGQGLYIGMFIVLNIILGAINYQGFGVPHPWGFSATGEILAYVGYRTGHISFALLPLTALFSSRNNFLLWITGWSFSTFLVLHRWVARLCTIHAIIHSITLLAAYVGTGTYYTDVHKPYWIWGIVALLCLVVMLAQSVAWFRRSSYEVFLILHILLAVFTIAGCWYHVYYWKGFTGIYELWLYMVCAVWFFDRLIRVFWVCKNGVRRATVTELSGDTVRVDIEGLRWLPKPGHHAYVYFPTLKPFRCWENHPFSITPTALLRAKNHSLVNSNGSTKDHSSDSHDIENGSKTPKETIRPESYGTDGITIYIKKGTGLTSFLQHNKSLPVLLDGPYRGNSIEGVLKCDRVLLIGGGIGITGLLPWAHAHVNVKLAWSVKQSAEHVVHDLSVALGNIADKEVLFGQRFDVDALLAQEVQAGWKRVGVVVCGPPALCDTVRAAVVSLGKQEKTIFELEVDAFSW